MSLVKSNRITNLTNDGPVEAVKGLSIPLAEKLVILGSVDLVGDGTGVGQSGQFLASTGTGVSWTALPQDISGSADVTFNSLTTIQDVTIQGSLQVNGTSIGLSNLGVGSNEIILNNDVVGQPEDDANIIVNRGDEIDTVLKWSEAQQRWQFTNDGVTYYNMLLPTETDFGVAEQFGASGDGNEYAVSSFASVTEGSEVYLALNLELPLEIANFRPNQYVKVFGASTTNVAALPGAVVSGSQQLSASAEANVLADENIPKSYYAYCLAQFNIATGDIGPFELITSTASPGEPIRNVSTSAMNEANYNLINITRTSNDFGILVYRGEFPGVDGLVNAQNAITNIAVSQADFELVYVMGPKEFPSDTTQNNFQDYGSYDQTDWSKRGPNGVFIDQDTLHFPFNPPTQAKRGWVTAPIREIQGGSGTITIDLPGLAGDAVPEDIRIVHDDTIPLQTAIDAAVASNKNFLVVPGGTYLVDQIVLPDGFTLKGLADATIFKKQYWSTNTFRDNSKDIVQGSMFVSTGFDALGNQEDWGTTDTTVGELTIDGNAVNQILWDDSGFAGAGAAEANNALVSLPNSSFLKFNSVKIRNSSGAAIFAEGSTNLSIENCNIIDGAETERYDFSTVLLSDGENTKVNASIFQNFPQGLDFTVSRVVAISGCVIRNCGSGIRIFGSTSTDVLNNLTLGPADEFIPVPDQYDSDYDSVNININYSIDYETPTYTYTESGQAVDLSTSILRMQAYDVTIEENAETVDFENPFVVAGTGPNAGEDIFQYFVKVENDGVTPIDDITLGQVSFRLNFEDSSQITRPTSTGYSVYEITGVDYNDVGSDINNVLGVGTDFDAPIGGTPSYTVTVTNPTVFASITIGEYVKLVGHNYTPDASVDTWKVVNKLSTGTERFVLEPYLEDSKGELSLVTGLTSVGTLPTVGLGYLQKRRKFLIAKGIITVVS